VTATLARLDWEETNQRHLVVELARVRDDIASHLGSPSPARDEVVAPVDPDGERNDDQETALAAVVRAFHLSSFERDVLLLCAGVELDARFGAVLATGSDAARGVPTFGLALAAIRDAHWSALTPEGPLRAWRLIELIGSGLTTAELRIDERILHFLAGINELDGRLQGLVAPLVDGWVGAGPRSDPEERAAGIVATHLSGGSVASAVQMTGGDPETRLAIAARAAALLGAVPLRLRSDDIPPVSSERYALARLLDREALLARATVVIEIPGDGEQDPVRVAGFAVDLAAPLVVLVDEPLASLRGRGLVLQIEQSAISERSARWRELLGVEAASLNGAVERLAGQFDLGIGAMRSVTAQVQSQAAMGLPLVEQTLWDAARLASRPRMDGLAQRIEPASEWSELVLPDRQRRILAEITTHVRQRQRVYEDWGFARKSSRGLGISALFAGASGTGKTMAAEALANDLRLDLYRIDLASVVSKYIGETEKNLKRLFDAAEGCGAILLFDEADALFGKRSEVRDSHDRYANIEVSYLLQRIETYRGLSILTSNMRNAIDPAFLRRIRFVVDFPFPDAEQRAAIWRGIFPSPTPTDSLDYDRLAQLSVSGGHIRNVALAGAFLAADHGQPVGMAHLAAAARSEYAKLERSMTDAELRGWE
jgi:hypothetical protein